MSKLKSKISNTIIAFAAIILVAAFGRAIADERPSVVVAVQDLPSVLEQASSKSTKGSAFRVLYNLYDWPLRTNFLKDYKLEPGLATSLKRIDDTTYEMELRRGVKFHDGTEMTADDVVFSFGPERLLKKGAPGYRVKRQFLGPLAAVEKIGDYKVRLKTAAPDPVFEKRMGNVAAEIVSRAAYEAAGNFDKWALAPVGTGPFRVVEFKPNEYLQLEAHDAYWGGKPTIKSLRFQLVPELSARIAGLLAGDFDIIANVTPDQIEAVERHKGFRVVGGALPAHQMVGFDVNNNPQLKDVKLRRALSLAVDRKLIVDSLWHGRIDIPNGHQLPAFGALYDPNRPLPQYNPEKAKALLAASSYKGEVIPYRSVGSYYPVELPTAQALVEMWRKVGINVKLELVENWSQVRERPGTGIYNGSDGMRYPDPLSTLWRRWGAISKFQKRGDWSNDEFNRLGEILGTSMDQEERKKAYQRMLDIFDYEDPPGIILHAKGRFYGIRDGLEWKPYPAAQMDFRPGNVNVAR
ncbi:MAG: ABC transporter substrate-binding protein [Kiloniellales bacterium]|nr:ABC transporter substrate-binding protein [Kiloniellales bacterium]